MSAEDPEDVITPAMLPLLERGRVALRTYAERRPFVDDLHRSMTIATTRSMHVVTRADFVQHVELCLDHVELHGMPTHILCASGPICLAVEKRETDW